MGNHVLIKDPELNGWEYGMLRAFEAEIIKQTNATTIDLPANPVTQRVMKHFGQGMSRGKFRKYFPQQPLALGGETVWYILMGPENYRLDLFKNWQGKAKTKILYLFDTLPSQYPLIKRLFSNNDWDILITSFNDAVQDLTAITGRKWYCLEQAADEQLFDPAPFNERLIHFSSYGRRYPALHEAVKDFCTKNDLYYDFTTHDARHPVVDSPELYKQYAWHLNHSLFTFSWPVELTNPQRAGHLHPITCRWFEAAVAGTVILGKAPGNDRFNTILDGELVLDLDPASTHSQLVKTLDRIWEKREELFLKAQSIRKKRVADWLWSTRVKSVLAMLETKEKEFNEYQV